jgi:hypothetical protein
MIITEEQVLAAAPVDPRELDALLAAGRPEITIQLARSFEEAGRTAHEAYQRGVGSHGVIAESYTNDGAPVLEAEAQNNRAHRLLGGAGRDLEDTSALLKRSVTALDAARQTSTGALGTMRSSLQALLQRWNRFVMANAGTGGVTAADRDRAMAEGVGIVNAAAATVRGAIQTYDDGLLRDARELAARGYTADQDTLAVHLEGVPDTGALVPDGIAGSPAVDRAKEILGALGVPIGVLAAGMALKKSVTLAGKAGALARYYRYATRTGGDAFTQRMNARLAQRALQFFKEGFPKAGAHAERGAIGSALRALGESRAARLAGKAFLPLTVATGLYDAYTGGGYGGVRGGITRGLGLAGAAGAGALLFATLNPVGLTVAGGAVLAYGAWTAGNAIWDHRAEIAEGVNTAKDWAGDRLSDAGNLAKEGGKKLLSGVSFGLLG